MSSWLVIGASSFTGQHFCEYLVMKGEKIFPASLRKRSWERAGFDYVVNFAAANVVAPSWDHPYLYTETNCLDQIRIWDFLVREPPKRYIHISTPEVYGNTFGWVDETHAFNPSTPYAVSRAAAEMMLRCYHRQYKLPVIFTRGANVYGPGQQLYRLIPKLLWSIKSGVKFPLEGGGASVRAFVHVRDVCSAIETLALKGFPGDAYHISSAEAYSIRNLVQRVCDLCAVKFSDVVDMAPERPGKDEAYRLSDHKLRALGWTDKVSLVHGILEVKRWMEDNWSSVKDMPTQYTFKP